MRIWHLFSLLTLCYAFEYEGSECLEFYNEYKRKFYSSFKCDYVGLDCFRAIRNDSNMELKSAFLSMCNIENLSKNVMRDSADLSFLISDADFFVKQKPNVYSKIQLHLLNDTLLASVTRRCIENLAEDGFIGLDEHQFSLIPTDSLKGLDATLTSKFTKLSSILQSGKHCNKIPGLSVLSAEQRNLASLECIQNMKQDELLKDLKLSEINALSPDSFQISSLELSRSISDEMWKEGMETGEICKFIPFFREIEKKKRVKVTSACISKSLQFHKFPFKDIEMKELVDIPAKSFSSLSFEQKQQLGRDFWIKCSDEQFKALFIEENCGIIAIHFFQLSQERQQSLEAHCSTQVNAAKARMHQQSSDGERTDIEYAMAFTTILTLVILALN